MNQRRQGLILGCGYLGVRIAERLIEKGYDVRGTSRDDGRVRELRELGILGERFALAEAPASPLVRAGYDVVVYAVAPGRSSGESGAADHRDGLAACLEVWKDGPPGRFVLLSSTGVYSQEDGSWIDERSPTAPAGERQRLLIEGERLVLAAARENGFPGIVLRLGGLYGPGRSPVDWCRDPAWRARLGRGNREAYMNWVHADDAAAGVVLAAEAGRPGEVYLIVDDQPTPREEFYGFACERAGSPPLDLPSDPARLAKRCSNRKARAELGFAPAYPSYREGLAAL